MNRKCRWTETSLNDLKVNRKDGEDNKFIVNDIYFWTILKVNKKWQWTEFIFEGIKSEHKIYYERNLFLNDFKSEQKMAVNGNYFERFKSEQERSVKKINFSKSYTSDKKSKQKKETKNWTNLNKFKILINMKLNNFVF